MTSNSVKSIFALDKKIAASRASSGKRLSEVNFTFIKDSANQASAGIDPIGFLSQQLKITVRDTPTGNYASQMRRASISQIKLAIGSEAAGLQRTDDAPFTLIRSINKFREEETILRRGVECHAQKGISVDNGLGDIKAPSFVSGEATVEILKYEYETLRIVCVMSSLGQRVMSLGKGQDAHPRADEIDRSKELAFHVVEVLISAQRKNTICSGTVFGSAQYFLLRAKKGE